MKYRIVVHDRVREDIRRNRDWWAAHHSETQAERWFDLAFSSLEKLETFPQSHPLFVAKAIVGDLAQILACSDRGRHQLGLMPPSFSFLNSPPLQMPDRGPADDTCATLGQRLSDTGELRLSVAIVAYERFDRLCSFCSGGYIFTRQKSAYKSTERRVPWSSVPFRAGWFASWNAEENDFSLAGNFALNQLHHILDSSPN